jgi:digeranylgeranylglycerophospholipid reductase
MHDLLIVGGGVVGSYLAGEMAGLGLRVLVLEEHKAPGEDITCTGIVGRECLDLLNLPPGLVMREMTGATVFAPSGMEVTLESQEPQAFILDRPALDRNLAERAQACGAEYAWGSRAKGLTTGEGKVVVLGERDSTWEGETLVLACGFGPTLPSHAGLGEIRESTTGIQAEVASPAEGVEIYLGNSFSRGFFGWLVPTRPGRALVGLLSTRPYPGFQALLEHLKGKGRIDLLPSHPASAPIPLRPLPRTYGERLLAVGEAAGHVKPTTGGGIYYGLLGARAAVAALKQAYSSGDFSARSLARYQKEWHRVLGRELMVGRWARGVFSRLSDRQIDELVRFFKDSGLAEEMVEGFSFDWHSRLVTRALGHGGLKAFLRVIGVALSGGPAQAEPRQK